MIKLKEFLCISSLFFWNKVLAVNRQCKEWALYKNCLSTLLRRQFNSKDWKFASQLSMVMCRVVNLPGFGSTLHLGEIAPHSDLLTILGQPAGPALWKSRIMGVPLVPAAPLCHSSGEISCTSSTTNVPKLWETLLHLQCRNSTILGNSVASPVPMCHNSGKHCCPSSAKVPLFWGTLLHL